MKTFIAVMLFVAWLTVPARSDYVSGGNPCLSNEGTILSASGVTTGNSLTQVIPLISGQQIFVCTLNVQGVSGTSPTFSLSYGTGSNCGTGTKSLMPPFNTVANAFYSFPNPVTKVPAGNALCYVDTGTNPVQNFVMSYIQK